MSLVNQPVTSLISDSQPNLMLNTTCYYQDKPLWDKHNCEQARMHAIHEMLFPSDVTKQLHNVAQNIVMSNPIKNSILDFNESSFVVWWRENIFDLSKYVYGYTPLQKAIVKDDDDLFELELKKIIDYKKSTKGQILPHQRDNAEKALNYAYHYRREGFFLTLLESGVDINSIQYSLLLEAIENNMKNLFLLALKYNIDVNKIYPHSIAPFTALEVAATHGDLFYVTALVEAGANVNNINGASPALASIIKEVAFCGGSVLKNYQEEFEYLVNQGARLNEASFTEQKFSAVSESVETHSSPNSVKRPWLFYYNKLIELKSHKTLSAEHDKVVTCLYPNPENSKFLNSNKPAKAPALK